jgi:hypothetical protein
MADRDAREHRHRHQIASALRAALNGREGNHIARGVASTSGRGAGDLQDRDTSTMQNAASPFIPDGIIAGA